MSESCIIHQFTAYAGLEPDEIELLKTLELEPRAYAAGEVIRAGGERAHDFFTLKSGWAYACRQLADGDCQVLDIFLPGQVMGLREIGYDEGLSDLVALTDVVACPFPKQRLTKLFNRAPRLADLFMLIMAREQSMLVERLVNLGRRPANQRLAHFIVEMKARVAPDNVEFELPMNQAVIGDTLGLSSVHVSRTLKVLDEQGLVRMEGGRVRVIDFQALVAFSDFNPAYLERDVAWVRQGAGAQAVSA